MELLNCCGCARNSQDSLPEGRREEEEVDNVRMNVE